MNKNRRQLSRALQDSTRFHISDETRAAHLRAISQAVAAAPAPTVGRARSSLRRRIGGIALVGAILAGPTGVALAAQGSMPGSSLYPVKRAVEHIQSVFDSSTPAKHRLDELSQLIATSDDQSKITEAFGEAESAVAATSESDQLQSILDELRQKVPEETTTETSDKTTEPVVEPADGQDGSEVTRTEEPADETSDTPSETTVTNSDGSDESSGDHRDSSDTGSTDDSQHHSDSEG